MATAAFDGVYLWLTTDYNGITITGITYYRRWYLESNNKRTSYNSTGDSRKIENNSCRWNWFHRRKRSNLFGKKGRPFKKYSQVRQIEGIANVKMTTDEIMALTRGGKWKGYGRFECHPGCLSQRLEMGWLVWAKLEEYSGITSLYINSIIYSEISIGFKLIEDLESAINEAGFRFLEIPKEALFLAGKAYMKYKRRKGMKKMPLPDFFIGAQAAILDLELLTRDVSRYQTYFPTVKLIAP